MEPKIALTDTATLTRQQRILAAAVAAFGDWNPFEADPDGPEPTLPHVRPEKGEPVQVSIEIRRLESGFYGVRIDGRADGEGYIGQPLYQTSRRSFLNALLVAAKWAAFWPARTDLNKPTS